VKAVLLIDGHWLWYAAGKYGRPQVRKPKVDYLSLRNEVVRHIGEADLIKSIVYLTSQSRQIRNFAEMLKGFGYQVIIDGGRLPLRIHKDLAETESWDKIVLAVGSLDFLPLLKKIKGQKKIILVNFGEIEKELSEVADQLITLDQGVLYNGRH
jgi:hypothetical protein